MSEAALALQMAMLACLRADDPVTAFVGDRVFDAAPRNAAFPYIAFGPARASDWSTGTEDGSEHRITLHAGRAGGESANAGRSCGPSRRRSAECRRWRDTR